MADEDHDAEAFEAPDENWVEIRRASTPVEAQMVRDFLAEHGVKSAINGDSGGTRLPWQHTMMDIRIVISPRDVESAREVLTAMVATDADHPFRGPAPMERLERDDEPYVAKRSAVAAAMLGFMIPIGAGHFYARHGAAGTILCAGMVGSFLGVLLGRLGLAIAWAILVVIDVVGSRWAVKRFNEQRVPPESEQRKWAMAAVVVAFVAAWFIGGGQGAG